MAICHLYSTSPESQRRDLTKQNIQGQFLMLNVLKYMYAIHKICKLQREKWAEDSYSNQAYNTLHSILVTVK